MSIPKHHSSVTRTPQPSRFESPDELSSKAKALLGENYQQYSTTDKLKLIKFFERPLEKQRASESEQGILGEIRKRYKDIGGAGDALCKQASNMLKASLPTYVSTDLSSPQHASFESQLPKVIEKAEQAATQFADCPVGVKLQLYGFSLCAKYKGELNTRGGLANSYERLKQAGGGLASAPLGYEYKEAFNRRLRTYLPQEQNRALEQLEAEPAYDVRKQGMLQVLELALTKLNVSASLETSSSTTTANTTTTTTTKTTTGLVSSQRVIDLQTQQAAARILEPVNDLGHGTRLRLYLHYKMNPDISKPDPTFNPFNIFCPVSSVENEAEIEFQKRLKEESGKLDKQADIQALKDTILDELKCLLPNQFKSALSLIEVSQPNEESFKKDAEGLDWSVMVAGKTGSRASRYIDNGFNAPEILQVIAYSFDRNPERLNGLTEAQIDKVKNAYGLLRLPGSDIDQSEVRSAFVESLLPKLSENMQINFSNVLRLVDTKTAEESVLALVAEYLKDPSAIASPKITGKLIDTGSLPTDAPTTTTTTTTTITGEIAEARIN